MNESGCPRVSILIPVYNREEFIEETVESALNQSYADFEVIIVDNCSTDNTYKLLEEMARNNKKIKLFQNEKNLGPVKNWQKCLEYARGEYVKILWSDDLMAEDFLKITVSFLEGNDDVGFVYSKTKVFNENSEWKYIDDTEAIKDKNYFILNSITYHMGKTPVSPGGAMLRKQDIVIEEFIPNKIDVKHSENGAGTDLLILLNVFKDYKYCYYTNQTCAYFRSHENSITLKEKNLYRYYFTALKYYIEREGMSEFEVSLKFSILEKEIGDFKKLRIYKDILLRYGFENKNISLVRLINLYILTFKKTTKMLLKKMLLKK